MFLNLLYSCGQDCNSIVKHEVLAKLIQLEQEHRPPARPASPLTPEMRAFIDHVIAPILVKKYLAEDETEVENGSVDLTRTGKYANGV